MIISKKILKKITRTYKMKVFIKGINACAMRRQELQQYRDFLVLNGHEIVDNPKNCDVILLWTCAFRGDVRDNSLSEIKRYQKEFDSELIIAGCLPDIAPELLEKNFKARVVPWRNDAKRMEEIFGSKNYKFKDIPIVFAERNLCEDVKKFREENPDKDVSFHDQFIKLVVSKGCNYNCSYCSEKLAFPSYHSFSERELVAACRKIVKETGRHEVILLADSLGDYGCDIGSNLPILIRKLKEIHPELKIALNNLNPAGFIKFFDEMKILLKDGFIRHLDLPIQSASPKILKLMQRSYSSKDIDRIFTLLNDINFEEFDTHVIVGFPGETEGDFDKTLQFILRHRPKYVLASAYMEALGRPAYYLPEKIKKEVKKKRLSEFYQKVSSVDIICNTDGSQLSSERLRRLNII